MAWRLRAATLPAGKKRRKRRRVRLTGFVASELIASGIGESGSNAKLTRQSALMMTTGLFLFLCYMCVSFCPVLNHTLAQFIIVTISPRNELFPCLWSTKQHITKKMYTDSLKGGPKVARNFCQVLPGCCLAKQVHLLVHLCTLLKHPLYRAVLKSGP